MINDVFFSLIFFVEIVNVITFFIGLILVIFFRKEPYKTIAKKILIYSIISFVIGFGCCVGGIALFN